MGPPAKTGGGKYDREAEAVMVATDAHAVVLIVLGGHLGHGFEVSIQPHAIGLADELPRLLRDLADQIERGERPGP